MNTSLMRSLTSSMWTALTARHTRYEYLDFVAIAILSLFDLKWSAIVDSEVDKRARFHSESMNFI